MPHSEKAYTDAIDAREKLDNGSLRNPDRYSKFEFHVFDGYPLNLSRPHFKKEVVLFSAGRGGLIVAINIFIGNNEVIGTIRKIGGSNGVGGILYENNLHTPHGVKAVENQS